MLIQELSIQASLDLLARTRLGRLACAQGPQPYVVPCYFVYDANYLYSFSTVGQKIEWMRANPLVCVEADEVVSPQQWMSVVVFGRYEELPDTSEWQLEREFAYKLLQQYAMWWEPGYVKTILRGTERQLMPIFYRVYVDRISGHRASIEPVSPLDTMQSRPLRRTRLAARILRLVPYKLKQMVVLSTKRSPVWETRTTGSVGSLCLVAGAEEI
jgi:nitroimidazol reductase NimA-like FMN-containing flavoprotein (pyridoxamine 5'-phosphate oxidase superfamily)